MKAGKLILVAIAAYVLWKMYQAGFFSSATSSTGTTTSTPTTYSTGIGSSTSTPSTASSSKSIAQILQDEINSGVPSYTIKLHNGQQGSITVPDYYGLGQQSLQQMLNDLGKTYGDGVGYTMFQRIQAGDVDALYSTQSGTRSLMMYGNKSNSAMTSIAQGVGVAAQVAGTAAMFL